EAEAIKYAVDNAVKGSLIVLSSDVVPDALNLVMKLKEEEANKLYGFSNEEVPNLT
ncbi:MAG: cyanophycin synthetase, partial [Bacteroidia bacterium]